LDDQNTADLQSAFQQRENVEAALDQVIANVGADVTKHMNEVIGKARTEGIPPDARDGIEQILDGKGRIEDVDAQILSLQGYTDAARYHEERRDNYWKLRDAIRAGR
jgi:hypothetical protein